MRNPYPFKDTVGKLQKLAFEKGASEANTEWIEFMPTMWNRCCELTCQYMTPDCEFLNNACMAWTERKKSA